jgi:radical SAM protein with 4Fe4S-binding SPASM domain
MANISLTASCNRSCSFCFALDAMVTHAPNAKTMPLDRVESALDFLERSQIPDARLLGGEPTIHPDFCRIVDRVLGRGMRLMVFSGGLIPERALRRLAAIPVELVTVLMNVIPPATGDPRELARQGEVFARLGRRVVAGVTIDTPAVQIQYLLDFIEQYDLARSVRLGLAHPILNGANASLHPRHYPEVGRRVTEFGLRAKELGVRLEFDCGWVPCMFPNGALEALGKGFDEVGLRCNPILDLLPDGRVISCYPLASHAAAELKPQENAVSMRLHFMKRQEAERRFMLYRECETCSWRARGECSGGCLSASLGRQRQRHFSLAVPAGA